MIEIVQRRIVEIARQLRLDANDDGEVTRTDVISAINDVAGFSPITVGRYVTYLTEQGIIKMSREHNGFFVVKGGVKDERKN